LRVRAAVGRSFRAPTWTERYYQDPVNVGREDLDAERAWSGELGVDLASGGALRLSATVFARRAKALIDWARPPGAAEDTPWETRNVEEATFRGVEAETTIQGPLGILWTLGGAVLSVRSEEAGGYRSKYVLRPLAEELNAGLSRTISGGLSAALNGQRARRKGQDPYHLVDLRLSYRLGELRIHLDATNLLDADYPDITGYRAPGRGVFLGLEVGSR
jgi:iron complex outermembrane receptor protein